MGDDLDCAVCLAIKVTPVAWPSSCGHSFCRRCAFSILEKGSVKCPLCRSQLEGKGSAADVLAGRRELEPSDDALVARCRAVDPEEYSIREAADQTAVQSTIERCQLEEREGVELMLFHMGSVSLRYGQHIGICLFEPRYRMMVENALTTHDRRFGIVTDGCGAAPGASGRVLKLLFERRRPDGSYDVVVQVGQTFTVSTALWAVSPPAPPGAPPLLFTRAKLDDEWEDASALQEQQQSERAPEIRRSRSGLLLAAAAAAAFGSSSPYSHRRSGSSGSPSSQRAASGEASAGEGLMRAGETPRRGGEPQANGGAARSRSPSLAGSHSPPRAREHDADSADEDSPRAETADEGSPRGARSRAARSQAAMKALWSLQSLLRRASGGAIPPRALAGAAMA